MASAEASPARGLREFRNAGSASSSTSSISMLVSSSMGSAGGLLASTSGTGEANTSTNERKKSKETGEDHHVMRNFAVIVCSECLYLEFPGCDVHGVLYTERISSTPSMAEKTNTLTSNSSSSSSSSSSGRLSSAISTLAALTVSTTNTATSSAATTTSRSSTTAATGTTNASTREKVHAKCPKCTAATNNVRPFRDGCRRCKGPTTVYMWSSTSQEVTQAYEAFPPHKEEIEHTALICECCQSVIFPRSREVLTRRTAQHAIVSFAASGSGSSSSSSSKPLKVSNFQLSMPHVEGCPRKGMPLQTIAVQLPKTELKFVQERIDQCPLANKIEGGPQYRPRRVQLVKSQNPLHQIYLRLVSVIIKSFDTASPNALEPLKNVLNLFDKMKPLSLFEDWAPPRVFPETQVQPSKATCSSCFDSSKYGPEKAFESHGSNDESYWRSSTIEPNKSSKEEKNNPTTGTSTTITEKDEWICFQFDNPVMLTGISLKWHADHIPSTRFHVSVSIDDITYDTVAIVMVKESSQRKEHRLSFARNTPVTHLKVTFPNVDQQPSKSSKKTPKSIGLDSITCFESGVIGGAGGSKPEATRAEDLIENFQQWLSDAFFKSPCDQVRDVAFETLQRLVLASGSLCAMLQFAKDLLLIQTQTLNSQNLDLLSEKSQKSAQKFLLDVAKCFRQLMMSKDEQQQQQQSQASSASTKGPTKEDSGSDQQQQQDKNAIIQQISMSLQDEVTRKSIQSLSSAAGLSCSTEAPSTSASTNTVASTPSVLPPIWKTMLLASTTSSAIASEDNPTNATSSSTICPLASLSGIYPEIFRLVKRRSQVGLMLLYMLSEVTAWQMKRMQKAEEYAGKKEEELLLQLEEPFSIEVRPKFFDLSHQLLVQVLSKWLQPASTTASDTTHSLYDQIEASCRDMEMQIVEETSSSAGSQEPLQVFSPNTTCVALLQVITCNIRRLVLSRVDPAEIGILASSVTQEVSPSGPAALEPMVSSLEQLISLGAKRSDPFFSISLEAAAAVEVGMEAFYPSSEQRTQLLTSRMGKGATLEVQVRWPVQERDQEDPRYERLMLILQLECIKRGMQHALRGAWHSFMHLIIQVPPSRETAQVLEETFACCIQQAGFSLWQVVAGAQELSINLQRHLHWNRKEKMLQESGAGWIRVYPSDVATFDEVLIDVDHFVRTQQPPSFSSSSSPPAQS